MGCAESNASSPHQQKKTGSGQSKQIIVIPPNNSTPYIPQPYIPQQNIVQQPIYQPTMMLHNPHQQYVIQSALDPDKVLDIDDKTRVLMIWDYEDSKSQRFKFIPGPNGLYQIYSCTGGVVEVPSSSTDNSVQIWVGQPSNERNELWQITPAPSHENGFYIKSFCGKALDVSGSQRENGSIVIQYTFHGMQNQIWLITAA